MMLSPRSVLQAMLLCMPMHSFQMHVYSPCVGRTAHKMELEHTHEELLAAQAMASERISFYAFAVGDLALFIPTATEGLYLALHHRLATTRS